MTRLILLLLMLSLYCSELLAVRVDGLYQAGTEVADKLESSRKQAVKTALKMVLVKLTGDRSAPLKPALAAVVNNATQYVQEFSYRVVNTDDENKTPQLKLVVRFDEESLNNDLRNSGIPLWGNERPGILVWLAYEENNNRTMASLEETPELYANLQRRADQRGIQLLFPLMDLQDTANLRASDIWGNFSEPVLNASRRYNADVILTGSISSPFTGYWGSEWSAYRNRELQRTWSTEAELLALVIDEGLDVLVDSLAAEFAQTGQLGRVQLQVNNVQSVDQYASLLKYLKSLSAIQKLDVTRVEKNQVEFAITAHGGERALAQAIGLGSVLQAVDDSLNNVYEMLP